MTASSIISPQYCFVFPPKVKIENNPSQCLKTHINDKLCHKQTSIYLLSQHVASYWKLKETDCCASSATAHSRAEELSAAVGSNFGLEHRPREQSRGYNPAATNQQSNDDDQGSVPSSGPGAGSWNPLPCPSAWSLVLVLVPHLGLGDQCLVLVPGPWSKCLVLVTDAWSMVLVPGPCTGPGAWSLVLVPGTLY